MTSFCAAAGIFLLSISWCSCLKDRCEELQRECTNQYTPLALRFAQVNPTSVREFEDSLSHVCEDLSKSVECQNRLVHAGCAKEVVSREHIEECEVFFLMKSDEYAKNAECFSQEILDEVLTCSFVYKKKNSPTLDEAEEENLEKEIHNGNEVGGDLMSSQCSLQKEKLMCYHKSLPQRCKGAELKLNFLNSSLKNYEMSCKDSSMSDMYASKIKDPSAAGQAEVRMGDSAAALTGVSSAFLVLSLFVLERIIGANRQ